MEKTISASRKTDQKAPPGALLSARIELAGNGGVSVTYDHAPDAPKKGDKGDGPMGYYQPRRPDMFASIEEACHAIVQAAGGDSSLEESEEDTGKGKAA